MKKSSLTTAVLAGLAGVVGFAGSSNAVELNPDGTGEVLIYPYYTVNAGQQTLLSVINSTAVGKAVKVRFLEGYNSREVLDFNLFLSPYDVWTATVFAMDDASLGSTGGAMGTADHSCTVPSFLDLPVVGSGLHYQPFSNLAYSGAVSDTGPTGVDRTREGYVELITMADVTGATLASITHDSSGFPADCSDTNALIRDELNTAGDFLPPTGGLFGNGAIIDVADGVMYGYAADAVDGFSDTVLFYDSGSLLPNLAQVNGGGATTPIGGATAYVFQGGSLLTLDYATPNNVDAVSAIFQASALMNEWVADDATGTDWVVTFPTKRFYVDGVATAIPPFSEFFGESADGQSCTVVDATVYDREEGHGIPSVDDPFSPRPPGTPPSAICHEVNVLTIGGTTSTDAPDSVLGSSYDTLAVNVDQFGSSGWIDLNLNPSVQPHALRPDVGGTSLGGLPATGFAAERFINNNAAPGVLANYSSAFRHRIERTVVS